jgi:hypothetical protein
MPCSYLSPLSWLGRYVNPRGVRDLSPFDAADIFIRQVGFELACRLVYHFAPICQEQHLLHRLGSEQQIHQPNDCASFSCPGRHDEQKFASCRLDCLGNPADRLCLVIAASDFGIHLNLVERDAILLLKGKPLQILTGEKPADFTRGVTVPIPKKYRLTVCQEYEGIEPEVVAYSIGII